MSNMEKKFKNEQSYDSLAKMAHSVFSELSAGFIENMPAYHTKPNRLFLFFTGKYKSAM